MLKSSAASRPSSAGSNRFFAAFERRLVPAMRVLGDLPFVAAVREALPWSFIALAAALIAVFFFQPAATGEASRSLGLRIALALLPAFGVMAGALVVLLCVFLARRGVRAARAAAARCRRGVRARASAAVRPGRGHVSARARGERTLSRDPGMRRRERVDRAAAPFRSRAGRRVGRPRCSRWRPSARSRSRTSRWRPVSTRR